ncbi:Hypothetical predicted protein, partial [Podarcis lilfordi]
RARAPLLPRGNAPPPPTPRKRRRSDFSAASASSDARKKEPCWRPGSPRSETFLGGLLRA